MNIQGKQWKYVSSLIQAACLFAYLMKTHNTSFFLMFS